MLRYGMAHRIGSGESVNMMAYPWLPNDQDPYVHTVNATLDGQMFSSLMITRYNKWDTDLLADIFEDRDTNLILSIPLQNEAADSSLVLAKGEVGAIFC